MCVCVRGEQLGKGQPYLHHGNHAVVANRVGADGEVARRVSADDPVDGVPVRGMRLVGIYHRQISHHDVHLVLGDLAGELWRMTPTLNK